MTRTAEATGPGPMALVAVEQRFPPGQRILVDELASRMLPFGGGSLLAPTALPWARDGLVRLVGTAFPGLWAGVMCRKRGIDEALSMADGRFGAEECCIFAPNPARDAREGEALAAISRRTVPIGPEAKDGIGVENGDAGADR